MSLTNNLNTSLRLHVLTFTVIVILTVNLIEVLLKLKFSGLLVIIVGSVFDHPQAKLTHSQSKQLAQ